MVILLRRLARSAVLLAALLLSCTVALLMVMRGPLSRFAVATTSNSADKVMTPPFPVFTGNLNVLYVVESAVLKDWNPESDRQIKVPELKGKTLLRTDSTVPATYKVSSRSESQYVHEQQLPIGTRIGPSDAMVSMDFKIERFNVFVGSDNVITKAYWG